MCIDFLFREGGREGGREKGERGKKEKERERQTDRDINVSEKHPAASVSSRRSPDWESNLQTFSVQDNALTN